MASEEPDPRQAEPEEVQQDMKRQRTASPVHTAPPGPMSYEHEDPQPVQQVVVGGVRPSSSLSTGASYVDSYFLDPAHSPSPHNVSNSNSNNQQQQQQAYLPTPALPPQDPTPTAPSEAPPTSTEANAEASAEASGGGVGEGVVQGSSDFVTSAARGLSLLSQFGRPSEGGGAANASASGGAVPGAASPPPALLPPVADYLPTSVYPADKAVVHDAPPPLPTPQLPPTPTTAWPLPPTQAPDASAVSAAGGGVGVVSVSYAPAPAAGSPKSSGAVAVLAPPPLPAPLASLPAPPPVPVPAPPTGPPPPASSGTSVTGGSNREGRCIVRGSNCTGSTNFILEGLNPDTGRPYTRNDGGACRECAKVDVRFAGTDGAKDPGKCRSARRDWCQYVAPHSQARCREEACFVDERTGCYTRCSTHSKEDGVRLPNLRRAEHFGCMGTEVAVIDEVQVLDNHDPQVGDVLRVQLQLPTFQHPKTLWAKVERLQKPSLVVALQCESQASFRELKPPGLGHEWWCKKHAKDHPEAVPMRGKRGRDWNEAYGDFVKHHGPTAYVDNAAPKRTKKDGAFRVDHLPLTL